MVDTNLVREGGLSPRSTVAEGAEAVLQLVREHAAWAPTRVGSAAARSALASHASVERDASVMEELLAAGQSPGA